MDALKQVLIILCDDGEGIVDPVESILAVKDLSAHHCELVVIKIQLAEHLTALPTHRRISDDGVSTP